MKKRLIKFKSFWSISIYKGESPFMLTPMWEKDQSILDGHEVTDRQSKSVADPFLYRKDDRWYLYYEVVLRLDGKGVIGLASSNDLQNWEYHGTIIEEDFHMSYPQIFEDQGELYMIPETRKAGGIRLYRCTQFPDVWEFDRELFKGDFADPTLHFHEGKWYLFILERKEDFVIHYAEQLMGPWKPHAMNPIIADDPRASRLAGKILLHEGKIYRLVQDGYPMYGTRVRAFEITELSPETYQETEHPDSPILNPKRKGWNGSGMHHMDAHQLPDGSWMAAVDGRRMELSLPYFDKYVK